MTTRSIPAIAFALIISATGDARSHTVYHADPFVIETRHKNVKHHKPLHFGQQGIVTNKHVFKPHHCEKKKAITKKPKHKHGKRLVIRKFD